MPSRARLQDIQVGDAIAVLPHVVCPADGADGHGDMDEACPTGGP